MSTTHSSVTSRPKHFGTSFAPPLHTGAEGPTDPSNTKLPTPFVVAVLGASRGIGKATALAYAKAGASGFILTGRQETSVHDTAKSILAIQPNTKIVCQSCDVSKAEEVREASEAARTAFGRLDVCVLNAGVAEEPQPDAEGKLRWPAGVTDVDPRRFIEAQEVNFFGTFYAAKYFVPLLEESSDGACAFIAVNSTVAHQFSPKALPMSYSVSKFASARVVEMVHEAHHNDGKGVMAFALHPGGVKTDLGGGKLPDHLDPAILTEDAGLCGGFSVWLTREKRPWLSGRWISSKWDTETLEKMRDEIVSGDKLKFRTVV